MIQLYGLNHNKLYALTNYKDLKIERTLDGEEILSFSYPQTDTKYDSIKEEVYLRTKKNEYVVKELNVDDDWTEFVAKINLEELKGSIVGNFETVDQSCNDTINLALVGTGWTIGSCDVVKKRTVRKANCSVYDILQEIRNVYRCDFKFDSINKRIYVYQSMGNDKGAYFSEQLNLKKLGVESNSYDFCTRIIPKGKDRLSIKDINGGKEYVENYQYSTKVITVYWEDNRYTDAQSLLEDANLKLNELSKPMRAYSAEIFDLANNNEKYKDILAYDLGDTITLLSKDKKVREKQRIVKITEYPDEPERNSCEIANKTLNFADIQAENQAVIDSTNNILTSDGGIDGSKIDNVDATTQIRNLNVEVAKITNLSTITANIDYLYSHKASIDELSATTARVGTLEVTTATITQLNTATANINNLIAAKANISDLSASNGRISNLETNTASINTLLAGNLTAANMQTNFITANSGIIANGAIKDAMIDTLSVSKILAGDISTTKFRIVSSSGNMLISDNTIQIKDASRVRIQIGKDASNDYNMYVWDSSGNLMFDATGLKASGIKSKIIRDDMVSDTANINGAKIEKESLITQINGATTLLKAAKIKLDTENQTLDLAFTSLKTTVTNTANTVSSQGTSISTIQGQISSKIWSTDITTAVNNIQVGGRNYYKMKSFKASGGVTATFDDTNKYWVLTIPSGSTSSWRGISYTDKNAVLQEGKQYTISYEVYADDVIPLYADINNQGLTTNVGVNDNDIVTSRIFNCPNTIAGSWVKAYITIKMPDSLAQDFYDYSVLGIGNGWVPTKDTTIKIKNIKFEQGNKPTDWSPAPEDIQGQIDWANNNISTINNNYSSLNQTVNSISTNVSSLQSTTSNLGTRMNSAETSISQLNNSIVLKVSTTDFSSYQSSVTNSLSSKANQSSLDTTNSNLGGLTTRVSTAESSIGVLQNQIVLKVTQTDIDNSIKDIDIGGRNLILNSVFNQGSDGLSGWTNQGLTIVTGKNTTSTVPYNATYVYMVNTNAAEKFLYALTPIILKPNTTYILSFYYHNDMTGGTATGDFFVLGQRSATTGSNYNYNHNITNLTNTNGQWIYKTLTFTTAADEVKCILRLDNNGSTSGAIRYTLLKLEEGNMATSWNPAPEDTQGQIDSATTRISNAETTISQLSNSITLKVSTSDFSSYQSSVTSSLNSKANQSSLDTTNGNLGSLTTRVSTAESSIGVLQNQIVLKVTQTDINNTINATQSDNLLRNTEWLSDSSYWTLGTGWVRDTAAVYLSSYTMRQIQSGQTASKWYALQSEKINCKPGEIFTGSVYTYSDNITTFDVGATLELDFYDSTNTRLSYPGISITPTVNGTWKRFSATGTAPANATYVILRIHVTQNGRMWVARPMLQSGSVLTGWSKCLNDIVDPVVSRVSTAESTISQLSNSISLKVNTSDFNSLTNRVSTAESSISLLQGQISSKVSTGDFSSLITQNATSVKVAFGNTSSTNLVHNGRGLFGISSWRQNGIETTWLTCKDSNASKYCPFPGKNGFGLYKNSSGEGFLESDTIRVVPGNKYTFSAIFAKETNVSSGEVFIIGSANDDRGYGWANKILDTNVWIQKLTATFTIPSGINYIFIRLDHNGGNNSGGGIVLWVTDIQLVEGDKVGEWTAHSGEILTSSIQMDGSGLTVNSGAITINNSDGRKVFTVESSGYMYNEWGIAVRCRPGDNIYAGAGGIVGTNAEACLYRNFGLYHESTAGRALYLMTNTHVELRDLNASGWKDISLQTVNANGDIWANGYVSGSSIINRSQRELKTDIVRYEDYTAYVGIKDLNLYNYKMKSEVGTINENLYLGTMIDEAPQEIIQNGGGEEIAGKYINIYSYISYVAAALKVAINKIESLEYELEKLNERA